MPAAAAPASAPPGAAPWLAALAGAPLPGPRQEDWRFTDLAVLARIAPHFALSSLRVEASPLPAGIEPLAPDAATELLGSVLETSGSSQHWPVQLNRAAIDQGHGAFLALRICGRVSQPLLLSRLPGGSGLGGTQLVLLLEPGADLELLEVISGEQAEAPASALSSLTVVSVGEGASLRAGMLALGRPGHSLLAHWIAVQEPSSRLAVTTVLGDWDLARFEPRIVQTDGAAETRLRTLQSCRGEQIVDTHSLVRFDGPDGSLDQLHKAMADGRGRSVFRGAVQVPGMAQRTRAAQLSRNLLLSPRARIDTKPELEIVADDVTCTHGATVSCLRDEELFYLQSRGIAAPQASDLLKRAFCEDVLRDLPAEAAGLNPLAHLLDPVGSS
ncbi:MAG: SufD family Fe-S cluster assembly protein [Cyanobacteriota bacterium]|nr:SufD family Fe-S cluster assembly protein [Cyanobacteriota bacterium]